MLANMKCRQTHETVQLGPISSLVEQAEVCLVVVPGREDILNLKALYAL